MALAEEFRACLEVCDVDTLLRIWAQTHPHLPAPKNREQALIVMHHARTVANSVSERGRFYSHAWLRERLLPSGLPDHMKPKAERLYPVKVGAVGVSVSALNGQKTERHLFVEKRMSLAVEDAYANGDRDPVLVKKLMMDAKAKAQKYYG